MTATNGNEALAQLVCALNQQNVAYMLVGSYSSNAYGIPRATNDADLVVEILDAALASIKPSIDAHYLIESQQEFELFTGTIRRVIRFQSINFVVEFFQLSDDAFDQARFRRRVRVQSDVLGGSIWLPTPEDVIVQKLRWSRPQDLMDAENVMMVQHDILDWNYIRHWTTLHGTTHKLEEIFNSL